MSPYNGIPDDVIEYLGKKDAKRMPRVMVKGTAKDESGISLPVVARVLGTLRGMTFRPGQRAPWSVA